VTRPRIGGSAPADRAVDDALRRRAARRVVAAGGVFVAIPLMGVAAVAAIALGGFGCLPVAARVAQYGLMVIVPAAAILLRWSTQALIANGIEATHSQASR
jgi:hypothetical protein